VKVITIFILLCTSLAFGSSDCSNDIKDLTLKKNEQARIDFIANTSGVDQSGIRIGFGGIKEMNNFYGLGGVNDILGCKKEVVYKDKDGKTKTKKINGYEGDLRDSLKSEQFKRSNPNINVEIFKTDFKGYYAVCTPMPSCAVIVQAQIDSVPAPKFPKPATEKLAGKEHLVDSFTVTSVKGKNYKEAYVDARKIAEFGDDTQALHEYVDKKMKSAIKKATGKKSINKIPVDDPTFMKQLSQNIEEFRNKGIDSVDPKFRDLVGVLDIMESPFASADNIESEISSALQEKGRVTTAKTGDDLFLIVKDGQNVEKIIGADARGLGVTNMTTRFQEYLKFLQSGKKVENMQDIIDISETAMKSADEIMDKSLSTYNDVLVKELKSPNGRSIDQMIRAAHDKYVVLTDMNPKLMQIRAGALDDCGKDPKVIMNRVTAIHNRLKLMEKANVNGFFGMSCLGTEYFLRLSGLK
jgi:hypothetical protein